MTIMQRVTDGFQNLVANLGTSRDKSFANGYTLDFLSRGDLLAAYRSSAIAKNIIDMPAEDSCREWRAWQAEANEISKLEAEEKRLGVQRLVMDARIRARLFGGSAIYIGTGDVDLEAPLDPGRVGRGGLQYLTPLDMNELAPDQLQLDPRLPGFGFPVSYTMQPLDGTAVRIHPSRLAIFRGEDPPDSSLRQSFQGWGDSVLTAVLEKVKHLDATVANVAALVFEAKVDVIRIKDFMSNLQTGGQEYENLVLRRFGLAAVSKGINGALLMDEAEEYDQKSANFSNLPDIMDRFMQVASAAARIPMTRLFAMSPAGLNSTGESDMRTYYDRIRQEQTLDMEPAMSVLDECLIRSALGNRPEELHFTWRPLWQQSAKEVAENADKLTLSLERLMGMDVLAPEVIATTAVNVLTECGAFPGLESAFEEFGSADFGSDDDNDPPPAADPMTADAAPRTLYVRRDVLNAEEIIAWAKSQGFKTTLPVDDMHVTVAFSRQPVDWMKVGQSWTDEIEVPAGGARLMDRFGEAKVLLFVSSELSWRHEEMKREGASWDHPEYQPHITISYDADSPAVGDIEPYRGKIVLGPEIFEEVNPRWAEGIKEE
jgi:uncharacterized protein